MHSLSMNYCIQSTHILILSSKQSVITPYYPQYNVECKDRLTNKGKKTTVHHKTTQQKATLIKTWFTISYPQSVVISRSKIQI